MKHFQRNKTVRMLTAVIMAVAVIVLSTMAAHAPARNQSTLSLKNIRTDNTAIFYADRHPTCAWFVEAVYADHRPSCAWFVEAVAPSGGSSTPVENLRSFAATL
jgi:hypothetical protein